MAPTRDPFAEWEAHNHSPATQDGAAEQTELVEPLVPEPPLPSRLTRSLAPGYSGEEMELFRRRLRAQELRAAALVGVLGLLVGGGLFWVLFSRLQAPVAEAYRPPPAEPVARPVLAPAPAPGPPEVTVVDGALEAAPAKASSGGRR